MLKLNISLIEVKKIKNLTIYTNKKQLSAIKHSLEVEV